MRQNCVSLEEYLEQIELHLLGYPKVERENYLEELADGLLHQFHDYCVINGIPQEKASSIGQYIGTLDKPKEVAQQYIKSLNIQLPFWAFPLRLWKKFKSYISRNTVFAAWLIGLTLGLLPIVIENYIPWLYELFISKTSGELGNETYYLTETNYFLSVYIMLTFVMISLLSWCIGRNSRNFVKVIVFAILSLYTFYIPFSLSYLIEDFGHLQEMFNSSAIHITHQKSFFMSEYLQPLTLLVRQLNILLSITIVGFILSFMINGIQRIRKASTSNWRKSLGFSFAILTIFTSLSLPMIQASAINVEPDSSWVYGVQSALKGYYPPESSFFEINESYATQCWILGNLSILWHDYITVNITNSPSAHFEHLLNDDHFEYDDDPGDLVNGSFIWIWPFTAITEWKNYAIGLNGTVKEEILIQATVQEDSQRYIENRTSLAGRMDLVVDLESRLPTLIILEGDFTQNSDRDSIIITRRYAYSFPRDVNLTPLLVTDLIIFVGLAIFVTLASQGAIWLNEYLLKAKPHKSTPKYTG